MPPEQFANRFALWWEGRHGARSEGRVFGYLLFTGTPQSVQDLTNSLGVSASSLPAALGSLERQGLVQRVRLPGKRRIYYTLHTDYVGHLLLIWLERINNLHALALEARDAGTTPDTAAAFVSFCAHLSDTVTELVATSNG